MADMQAQVMGKGYTPTQDQNVDPINSAQSQLSNLQQQASAWMLEQRKQAQLMYPNDPAQQNMAIQGLDAMNPYNDQIKTQKQMVKELTMRSQGLNPDGSPIAKEFETILDKDGNLPDKYKYVAQQLDPNTLEGYSMLKAIAQAQGPSKYAEAANKQSEMGRQDTIDAAARQSDAAAVKARSDLAMRGGASAGSRERLMMNAGDNLMASKQGAYRTQGGQLLDIMKEDEKMKRDALTQFGDAEGKIAIQNTGVKNMESQYNLGTMLKEAESKRMYNQDNYKTAMDKWGANKQAEATRGGGGGGK